MADSFTSVADWGALSMVQFWCQRFSGLADDPVLQTIQNVGIEIGPPDLKN